MIDDIIDWIIQAIGLVTGLVLLAGALGMGVGMFYLMFKWVSMLVR